MKLLFAKTLKKHREEAGFSTAYQFFHKNGGEGYLKTSYRMYLHIEHGKFLPPFKDLPLYMYALHIMPGTSSGINFLTAWFKAAYGEEAFGTLLAPILIKSPEESVASPLHKAIDKLLMDRTFHISHKQLGAIARNRSNALCWTALCNDEEAWKAKDLAATLGISLTESGNSLRELAKAKLIKRLKTGAYKFPMAGAMIEYPPPHSSTAEISKRLLAIRNEMIASGRLMFRRSGIIRASLLKLVNCFPLLSLNVSTAQTYATFRKEKDSALFGVECKVVKIRDF